MTTKGSLTSVAVLESGEKYPYQVTKRQVMWMDGYDAWLCVFKGIGDTPRPKPWQIYQHKPTLYRFTYYYPRNYEKRNYEIQKTITLSKGHTPEDDQYIKERTMKLHRGNAGSLICHGYKLAWLNWKESKECLEYYMGNTDETIDLDEETNDGLLTLCRVEAKKNGCVDCEGCKLKFLCWTHRSMRHLQMGLDKKYNIVV